MTCVKPFTIPDLLTENGFPDWDTGDTFDRYDDHTGMVLLNADVYNRRASGYSGYHPTREGMLLTIRASNEGNIEPSMYCRAMPGGTVATRTANISGCTPPRKARPLSCEPGDKVGPTSQGIDDLIAKDPNAYWDDTNKRVVSTTKPSPRVFPIPLFDPDYYEWGKVNGRPADLKVSNWIGFFVVDRKRRRGARPPVPIQGIIKSGAGPAPNDIFPKVIRLVE